MIDPATSWFEVIEIPDETSETIALLVDRHWLCRYPRPRYITFDQGGEFTGNEFQELIESYGIKVRPSTSRNPQSNGVIERVHNTIHNMLRTFGLHIKELDLVTTWQGYLASIAFAIHTTYHTSLKVVVTPIFYEISNCVFLRHYRRP